MALYKSIVWLCVLGLAVAVPPGDSPKQEVPHESDKKVGAGLFAFEAVRSTDFDPTAGTEISFDSVTYNYGNGFNPDISIFTAPSPGLYVFDLMFYGRHFDIYLNVNSANQGYIRNADDGDWYTSVSSSRQLVLQQGDTVRLTVGDLQPLAFLSCSDSSSCMFSGRLIHEFI